MAEPILVLVAEGSADDMAQTRDALTLRLIDYCLRSDDSRIALAALCLERIMSGTH